VVTTAPNSILSEIVGRKFHYGRIGGTNKAAGKGASEFLVKSDNLVKELPGLAN
jgi:hypothetical protein